MALITSGVELKLNWGGGGDLFLVTHYLLHHTWLYTLPKQIVYCMLFVGQLFIPIPYGLVNNITFITYINSFLGRYTRTSHPPKKGRSVRPSWVIGLAPLSITNTKLTITFKCIILQSKLTVV